MVFGIPASTEKDSTRSNGKINTKLSLNSIHPNFGILNYLNDKLPPGLCTCHTSHGASRGDEEDRVDSTFSNQ